MDRGPGFDARSHPIRKSSKTPDQIRPVAGKLNEVTGLDVDTGVHVDTWNSGRDY